MKKVETLYITIFEVALYESALSFFFLSNHAFFQYGAIK